jgi:hypothetical protein
LVVFITQWKRFARRKPPQKAPESNPKLDRMTELLNIYHNPLKVERIMAREGWAA